MLFADLERALSIKHDALIFHDGLNEAIRPRITGHKAPVLPTQHGFGCPHRRRIIFQKNGPELVTFTIFIIGIIRVAVTRRAILT